MLLTWFMMLLASAKELPRHEDVVVSPLFAFKWHKREQELIVSYFCYRRDSNGKFVMTISLAPKRMTEDGTLYFPVPADIESPFTDVIVLLHEKDMQALVHTAEAQGRVNVAVSKKRSWRYGNYALVQLDNWLECQGSACPPLTK